MKLTKEMLRRVRKREGIKYALWVYLRINVFKIKEGGKIYGKSKICKSILFPIKMLKWKLKIDKWSADNGR